MTRYYLLRIALITVGFLAVGCDKEENRTVETQGELWDERAAFYANEDNFSDTEYVDEETEE